MSEFQKSKAKRLKLCQVQTEIYSREKLLKKKERKVTPEGASNFVKALFRMEQITSCRNPKSQIKVHSRTLSKGNKINSTLPSTPLNDSQELNSAKLVNSPLNYVTSRVFLQEHDMDRLSEDAYDV